MKPETPSSVKVDTRRLFLTNKKLGLSSSEALKRQKIFGKNELQNNKEESWFKVLLSQFRDLMNIILLVICGLLIVKSLIEIIFGFNSQKSIILKFIEPFAIFLVVCLNALLTAYQIIKTNKSILSLKNLVTPTAKVIRDGEAKLIESVELVLGDIIILEAGDIVPADGELLEAYELKVVESSITGESGHVFKKVGDAKVGVAPLSLNQDNYIYSSSQVVGGSGLAVVRATGAWTQIGNINTLVQKTTQPKTPLQIRLDKLAKYFSYGAAILFIVSFLLQIGLQGFGTNLNNYIDALVNSIALAVGAVPEGLIVFSSAVLALNVKKMKAHNVIIKHLQTIETIGSTSIICSDKTGTLTKNIMSVSGYFSCKNGFFSPNKAVDFLKEIEYLVIANEAKINNQQTQEVGDPTEIALLKYGLSLNINANALLEKRFSILKVLPFSSERKMMSMIVKTANQNLLISKGALEMIISKSKKKDYKEIQSLETKWSSQAQRVLALAMRPLTEVELNFLKNPEFDSFSLEENLEILGLVALEDPIREDAKKTISECKKAGIKTIMMTGDNIQTAVAIAKKVGIFNESEGDVAISGDELDKLDEETLSQRIHFLTVFARVLPRHKLRVVRCWQNLEEVVTVTGDGVNDSPALKAADVGCVMGKTGTDVSKDSADVILLEENFATIVEGVKQGRRVFLKLQNVLKNLLITSVAAIVGVLLGLIFISRLIEWYGKSRDGFYMFNGAQILFLNLVTHGFPAMALGMIEPLFDVFAQRPKPKNTSPLDSKTISSIVLQGSLIGILSIVVWGYVFITRSHLESSQLLQLSSSAAFLVFGLSCVLNALNLMDSKSILWVSKRYKYVYLAVAFSVFSVLLITFVPGLQESFSISSEMSSLSSIDIILFSLLMAFVPSLLIEAKKAGKLVDIKRWTKKLLKKRDGKRE